MPISSFFFFFFYTHMHIHCRPFQLFTYRDLFILLTELNYTISICVVLFFSLIKY